MKTLAGLLVIGSLLVVTAVASAETLAPGTAWILYRQDGGQWFPGSTTYVAKAECEQRAYELATRLKTYTGCAVGAVVVSTTPAPPRGGRAAAPAAGEWNSGAVRKLDAATAITDRAEKVKKDAAARREQDKKARAEASEAAMHKFCSSGAGCGSGR